LILIDDLHPHEAFAGVWQGNRHRPGIEVDNRERIQRVAVGPDNALLSGRSKLAAMPEFAKPPFLDHSGEIDVGLCAIVILDGTSVVWTQMFVMFVLMQRIQQL